MEQVEAKWDAVAEGLKAAIRDRDIEAAQDAMHKVRDQEAKNAAHVDRVSYEYVGTKSAKKLAAAKAKPWWERDAQEIIIVAADNEGRRVRQEG